tara:strand:- start:2821 stop:3399 length:579 start_codon:yes stop_codon:yes gene_type:complete
MKLLLENWRRYISEVNLSEGEWVDVDLADLTTPELNRIWTMYTNTYLNAGLDFSAADAQGLKKYKATFLIDVDTPPDGIADAFIIYKPTPFGNKMSLLGTCQEEDCNAKRDAKRAVVDKMFDLLRGGGFFLEAGLRLEELLRDSDIPHVCDEEKIKELLGDKFIRFLDDCYYERKLAMADPIIVKRIYGSFG